MLVVLGLVEQRSRAMHEVLDEATVTDAAMRICPPSRLGPPGHRLGHAEVEAA